MKERPCAQGSEQEAYVQFAWALARKLSPLSHVPVWARGVFLHLSGLRQSPCCGSTGFGGTGHTGHRQWVQGSFISTSWC